LWGDWGPSFTEEERGRGLPRVLGGTAEGRKGRVTVETRKVCKRKNKRKGPIT